MMIGGAARETELTRLHRRRLELAEHIAQLPSRSVRRAILVARQAEVTRRTLELEIELSSADDVPSPADDDQGQELKYFQK